MAAPSSRTDGTSGLYAWLDARLALGRLRELGERKTVPVHRYSVIYFFGGMTLFLFAVQVVTGILLMLYYRPSADHAYESVQHLMGRVSFGWLIRSVHAWSANLMVFSAFVHLASVYFAKAYRPPREVTWITGCLAFFVVLGFGFSGYLLPWNELAFFATKVGTQIPASLPVVGDWLMRFLRGGENVDGETLSRFYGWHVALLPASMVAILALHFLLVQIHGMSVPPGLEGDAQRRGGMRFVPHYALREVAGWLLVLAVIAALGALFPWELGEKADPLASAPAQIRPEWYFMFLYETLRLVPGGTLAGLEYEAIPILGSMLAALLLVMVPFLDPAPERTGRSRLFTALGGLGLVYAVGLTAWGYGSWVPLGVVAAAAGLVAAYAWLVGSRRTGTGGA